MRTLTPRRACILALAWTLLADAAPAQSFKFAVIGDMPYGTKKASDVSDLLKALSDAKPMPEFVVHVGDFQRRGRCSGANIKAAKDLFSRSYLPLIYTPGDNEWADCKDPLNSLKAVRDSFFATDSSLGQRQIHLERQAGYRENARFWFNGVLFATVHVVGSLNNAAHPDEFGPRTNADVAWIESTFHTAANASAVVFLFHAQVTNTAAFASVKAALSGGAAKFMRPVLLMNGDGHQYQCFTMKDSTNHVVPNVKWLEVMGDGNIDAIVVTVNPSASPSQVFAETPFHSTKPCKVVK